MQMLTGSVLVFAAIAGSQAMAAEHVIGQKDKAFVMNGKPVETITVKAGDSIRFVNEDTFFHNIFSLSELKMFDLGSFPKGESRSVVFDKPGTVDVECAIHPNMHLKVDVK